MFSQFKTELNNAIAALVAPGQSKALGLYHFCGALRVAYVRALTYEHIHASFERSGLWPLDAERFLKIPLSNNQNELGTLASVDELANLMQTKR